MSQPKVFYIENTEPADKPDGQRSEVTLRPEIFENDELVYQSSLKQRGTARDEVFDFFYERMVQAYGDDLVTLNTATKRLTAQLKSQRRGAQPKLNLRYGIRGINVLGSFTFQILSVSKSEGTHVSVNKYA